MPSGQIGARLGSANSENPTIPSFESACRAHQRPVANSRTLSGTAEATSARSVTVKVASETVVVDSTAATPAGNNGRIAARTAETKLARRNDRPLRLQRARSCAPASRNRTLESPIASQSGTPARPSPVAHIGSRDACEPEKETRTARTHRQTSVRHIHGDACTGRWRGLAR